MTGSLPWSRLFECRKKVASRYPSIWRIPVRKRYHTVLEAVGRDGMQVLEVGAGDRGLERRLLRVWPATSYRSFDIDRERFHDFYRLEDVRGEYDLVCMFEVVEHVRPEQVFSILDRALSVLRPGGLLLVTTPNIFCPPNYLRDATHVTPWCYDELGGIALLSGFEIVDLFRLYHDALLHKLMRRILFFPVHYSLRIDFAKQIMLVARKPRDAAATRP